MGVRLKTVGGSTNWLQPFLMANSIIADWNNGLAAGITRAGAAIGEGLTHKKDKAQQQAQFDATLAQQDSHFQQTLADTKAYRAQMAADRAEDNARDWDKFNAHLMAAQLKDAQARADRFTMAAQGDEFSPPDPMAATEATKAQAEVEKIRSTLMTMSARNRGSQGPSGMTGDGDVSLLNIEPRRGAEDAGGVRLTANRRAPSPDAVTEILTPEEKAARGGGGGASAGATCTDGSCDTKGGKAPLVVPGAAETSPVGKAASAPVDEVGELEGKIVKAKAAQRVALKNKDERRFKFAADAEALFTKQLNAAKSKQADAKAVRERQAIADEKTTRGVDAYKAQKAGLGYELTPEEDAAAMGAIAAGRDPKDVLDDAKNKRSQDAVLRGMLDELDPSKTDNSRKELAMVAVRSGKYTAKQAFDLAFPGETAVQRKKTVEAAQASGEIRKPLSARTDEEKGKSKADIEAARIAEAKRLGTYREPGGQTDLERKALSTEQRLAMQERSAWEKANKNPLTGIIPASDEYERLKKRERSANEALLAHDRKMADDAKRPAAPAESSYPSWLPAEGRKDWDSLSDDAKAKVLKERGR